VICRPRNVIDTAFQPRHWEAAATTKHCLIIELVMVSFFEFLFFFHSVKFVVFSAKFLAILHAVN